MTNGIRVRHLNNTQYGETDLLVRKKVQTDSLVRKKVFPERKG